MSGLGVAARYLTIVPVRGAAPPGLEDVGRAAPWFPVVGAVLGVALVVGDAITTRVFPPLLAALLTLTAWKALTGGLHLDGLADCLDGLVGRDSEQRLAIMHDSRIGTFGAMGLILFLLLAIGALADLPTAARRGALVAAPAIARATPVLLVRLFPAARGSIQGAAFGASVGRAAPAVTLLVALVVAVAALGWAGAVALAVALGVTVGAARILTARLDGITGDVLGAAIELAELATLLTVSAWARAAL